MAEPGKRKHWGGFHGIRLVDPQKMKHWRDKMRLKVKEFFTEGELSVDELHPDALMKAPAEQQKQHRYNVLGEGYRYLGDTFERGALLGKGSYGKVYEVTQKSTGRKFACKEAKKAKLFKSGVGGMMRTEVEIMQALRGQPGILQLEDVLEDSRSLYMILELCTGHDMLHTVTTKFASSGSYSEADAAAMMRSAAAAVQTCHQHHVIHRDIKPENFLWVQEEGAGGRGEMKLADFGLSTFWHAGKDEPLTEKTGTPPYIAPEVWLEKPYTTEPDIWALGCVLTVLLTGTYPFRGKSLEEISHDICNTELDMDGFPWGFLSQGARDLASRMLCKDPQERIKLEEVLTHPWVVEGGTAPTTSLTKNVVHGVLNILNMGRLHQMVIMLLAKAFAHSQEAKHLRTEFSKHDLDGDGTISCNELRKFMFDCGYHASEVEVEALFAKLDTDGSGELDFEEFVATEIYFRAQVDDALMRRAFQLMDRDGDGRIGREDLQMALEASEDTMSEELDAVFRAVDTDGNGCISFDEFYKFWHVIVRGDTDAEDEVGELGPCERQLSRRRPSAVQTAVPDFSDAVQLSPLSMPGMVGRANSRMARKVLSHGGANGGPAKADK